MASASERSNCATTRICRRCGDAFTYVPPSKAGGRRSICDSCKASDCNVEGCRSTVHSRGLCGLHYRRSRKGTPLDAPKGHRPKGPDRVPYKRGAGYEARLAARQVPQPKCACGCGDLVEWLTSKSRWAHYRPGHYRIQRPYKDRDWLYREYVEKGRTFDDIAADFGVAGSTIRHWARLQGISARTQRESLILSGSVSGEANPAWKGGTTPERQKTYKSQVWKETVKAVYARDAYRCVRCGHHQDHSEHALHAHHISTWATHPELRTDLNNLVTLCAKCHRWVHSKANTDREYLAGDQ